MSKIGKIVQVNLSNGFYFIGRVIDESEDEIIIIDKNSERVEIKKNIIVYSKEMTE